MSSKAEAERKFAPTIPEPPKFQLPQLPDARVADKLVKSVMVSYDITITNNDDYRASWPVIQRHDDVLDKIDQMFNPFVDGLHKLHKMAVQLRSSFREPVMESKKRWLSERVRFSNEQLRIKSEERRRDAERLQKDQAKKLLADAKTIEKTGDKELAAELRSQAQSVPLPSLPITPAVPKQAGSVVTTRWEFEIVNPDEVPRDLCDPTPSRIRKRIESGSKEDIPGVVKWQETKEHVREVRS